jgi:hypothetical protein
MATRYLWMVQNDVGFRRPPDYDDRLSKRFAPGREAGKDGYVSVQSPLGKRTRRKNSTLNRETPRKSEKTDRVFLSCWGSSRQQKTWKQY